MSARTPLSSRPLDLLYFTFFLIHLPASLLLDCQPLYPPSLVPSFISQLPKMYTQLSGDPLISGVMGYTGQSSDFVWFKTFIFVEMRALYLFLGQKIILLSIPRFFQVPVFILGMRGLWKDSRSIYLLMLIYGASTATTTLPCLTRLLSTPITSAQTIAAGVQSITESQRLLLLSSYLPFFLLPLFMALDMTFRVAKLLQDGLAMTAGKKVQ